MLKTTDQFIPYFLAFDDDSFLCLFSLAVVYARVSVGESVCVGVWVRASTSVVPLSLLECSASWLEVDRISSIGDN